MFLILFMFHLTLGAPLTFAINPLKTCSNCKHFFVEKNIDNTLQAKCLYFKKNHSTSKECAKRKETIYLVLGDIIVQKIEDTRDLYYCATARKFENMCDYDGKKYEAKIMNQKNEIYSKISI